MNTQRTKIATVCIVAAALSACGTTPGKNQVVEKAEATVQEARLNQQVVEHAPLKLNDAEKDLKEAKQLWTHKHDKEGAEHYSYLAERKASTAQQTAEYELAKEEIERADEERNKVLYEARSRQLTLTQTQANQAQRELQSLKRKVSELEARETERGLVLTLGDVLFDLNKAELKSGGEKSIAKLAEFLQEYPQHHVLIEGFTDGTGEEQYNRQLSRKRANAVRDALTQKGITRNRIKTRGYGEAFPVASNNSAAGRQQNRRVEIIISGQSGDIPSRED